MDSFITLLYHEILPPGEDPGAGLPIRVQSGYQDILPPPLAIGVEEFSAQMAFLASHDYQVIGIHEVMDFFIHGDKLPPRSVVLTFDDLWTGARDLALPILRQHGFPALGFPVEGWLFDLPQTPQSGHATCLARTDLARMADTFMWANHASALHGRIKGRTLVESATGEEFAQDLAKAQSITKVPGVFAWPFGVVASDKVPILKDCGFTLAFGTKPGPNTKDTEPFDLRRTVVPANCGLDRFATLLAP